MTKTKVKQYLLDNASLEDIKDIVNTSDIWGSYESVFDGEDATRIYHSKDYGYFIGHEDGLLVKIEDLKHAVNWLCDNFDIKMSDVEDYI